MCEETMSSQEDVEDLPEHESMEEILEVNDFNWLLDGAIGDYDPQGRVAGNATFNLSTKLSFALIAFLAGLLVLAIVGWMQAAATHGVTPRVPPLPHFLHAPIVYTPEIPQILHVHPAIPTKPAQGISQ